MKFIEIMDVKNYLKYKIMDKLLFSKCTYNKCKTLYEDFLLNIVNSSKYFLRKSNNEKYVPPYCESNGECDCNSKAYQLDFKLLISKSYMEGKSISALSYTYLPNGLCLEHSGRKESKNNKVGLIHKELASSYEYTYKFEKDDIESIIVYLKKHKHLLLFLPYKFTIVDKRELFNENDINEVLTDDIITFLIKHRKEYMNEYDTYFVYLFNENAIINKIDEVAIQFIDKVGMKENEIYSLVYN